MKNPLVSILIPAYNAERWIAESLRSAIAQTWPRKEILVVNDGSTDGTAQVARQFVSKEVKLFSTETQGLPAAVNFAFRQCQGDYIQELDSDDLISADKIELQMAALLRIGSRRILASSPWAHFYHRPRRARFIANSLWHDLSPVEWLLRKMGEHLHMQNATWLMSRELAEAAGPWDVKLHYDQDGEYFARVLLVSEGTRFIPEGRVFYRISGSSQMSNIGRSNTKRDSLLRSIKLHIQYLRSLEESERVRKACLTYLQNAYVDFYPQRPDIIEELERMAAALQGRVELPPLRRKYAWLKPLLGYTATSRVQTSLPLFRSFLENRWDRGMHWMES